MFIYRLVIFFLSPFVIIRFLFALIRGRETWEGLVQRLGFGAGINAPVIWFHGASLGELTSARPVMEYVLTKYPDLEIIVTSNTYTARKLISTWGSSRIHARLAPLDSPSVMRRFLARWQPLIAFTLENEVWPERVLACARSNISFVILGGRMSEKSAATWARFPTLARKVAGAITVLAPLDQENADRFVMLGVPETKISEPVNLKSNVLLPKPDRSELTRLSTFYDRGKTILAASTHSGEDEIILSAFARARQTDPDLRLIIAPRHPERGQQISTLISTTGLSFSQRSSGDDINMDDTVYLADTLGEMPFWYSAASVSIVGASFVDFGGHTPVEPTQFGSAIIHGKFTSNHAGIYAVLKQDNAAICANGINDLASAISTLTFKNKAKLQAKRARDALASSLPENADPKVLLAQINRQSGGKLLELLLG